MGVVCMLRRNNPSNHVEATGFVCKFVRHLAWRLSNTELEHTSIEPLSSNRAPLAYCRSSVVFLAGSNIDERVARKRSGVGDSEDVGQPASGRGAWVGFRSGAGGGRHAAQLTQNSGVQSTARVPPVEPPTTQHPP